MNATDKILLAETNRTAATAIARDLKKNGFDVVTAGDTAHVLNLARQDKPDMVLLNSQLAGSGVAILRRLRSNVYTTHIPVVAMVAAGDAARAVMMDAGAQDCVEQPVSAQALLAAIGRHLKQSLDFTQAPAEVLAAPERMAELNETGLLDSPPQESFDLLTRLTAKLLGAPVALVTLVDKDRQFFKSQTGLAEPWAGARQTRLSHSFCQWVVSGKEEVVVSNANNHPTLKNNLAIKDLRVIAYAGVPICGRSGQAIGSFCVIDSNPRDWSEAELSLLRDLAVVGEACSLPEGANGASKAAASAIAVISRLLRTHRARLDAAEQDALLDLSEKQAARISA